jgi:hypothetical protein
MAWSWSHTGEAYAAAERNLRRLDRGTLEEILAEWRCYRPGHPGADGEGFVSSGWDAALAAVRADAMPVDVLADDIWDRASDYQTCDNGGWNAWLCPFGCGPHCVPFDDGEREAG